MPTIIDSLIVKLGLDSKGVSSGAPKVTSNLKNVEKSATDTEKSFSNLARAAEAFLVIIGGTASIKAFIENFVDANAELDRFSKNIQSSVTEISAWGQAVEQVGGSASGLQGTLDMLGRSQTSIQLTGESSLIPYLSLLGVSLVDARLKAKSTIDELRDIGGAVSDRIANGSMSRMEGFNILRSMGIDEGTSNLIIQNRKELELTINRIKATTAANSKQTEEAVKLQRSIAVTKQEFEAFGRSLVMEAAPAIEKLLDWLMRVGQWVSDNREFVVDFLKIMAVGLGAIAIAALPIEGTIVLIALLSAAIALLWQDYQVWERGGKSFIDWGKWKPEIDAAIAGINALKDAIEGLFGMYTRYYERVTGHKFSVGNFIDDTKSVLGMKVKPRGANDKKVTPRGAGGDKLTSDQIRKYFESQGWTSAQSAGIAANLLTESGGRSNAVGDHGQAFGLAQWHPDRQAAFAKWAGHSIQDSTGAEQLAFIQRELSQRGGSNGAKALSQTTTAEDAAAAFSRYFERPANADGEAARRGELARSLMGIPGAATPLASASSAGISTTNYKSITTGDITIHTPATDAKGIVADLGHSFDYLFASQANTGLN